MRPEISLVLLTTLSGVGQGLFVLITVLFLSTFFGIQVPYELLIFLTSISLLFPALGGIASFFHLGRPGRGWKAIKQWKHSWLSREVALLPLFVGLAALFLLGLILDFPPVQLAYIALLASTASLGLYLASAMLYGAIHFIKEWANIFTVINFIIFGLTSGFAFGLAGIFFLMPENSLGDSVLKIITILGTISLLMKLLTYRYNSHLYNPLSLKNALGIKAAKIKIMETGSAYETYNSHEFYLPMNDQEHSAKRVMVLLVGFLFPLLIWGSISQGILNSQSGVYTLIAALSMLMGLFLERKLFFVQGNHVQNLYYGNFKSPNVANPLVISGRK